MAGWVLLGRRGQITTSTCGSFVNANLPALRGEVVEKEVEKIVKGGNDVAILRVKAGVCEKCGERFYTKEVHKKTEDHRDVQANWSELCL